MRELDSSFLEGSPFRGVPLFRMERGRAAYSSSLVAERLWPRLQSQIGDVGTPFLGRSNTKDFTEKRAGLIGHLPLRSRAVAGCDAWCLWFAGEADAPMVPDLSVVFSGDPIDTTVSDEEARAVPDLNAYGASLHLVFLSASEESLPDLARSWKDAARNSQGCLVFHLPKELEGDRLAEVTDGLSALVLSAWSSFSDHPDEGFRAAFGLPHPGGAEPLWIQLGIASFDWGRRGEQENLARRLASALRSTWLSPFEGAPQLPGFRPPGDLLNEILPRPELMAVDPDPETPATLITLGAHEYALRLHLPPPEAPARLWQLPRQVWREQLRRLIKLRFRADLGHLPQLQRLLDIRLERLPFWFERPLRESIDPLPESPDGFLKAVKARIEQGRVLLRPWTESKVERRGEAATDAHSDEVARRIARLPSLAGGVARLIPLLVALLWVGLGQGVFAPPFHAWEGEWGTAAWSGVLLGTLVLSGGVFWFLWDRNHFLGRAFQKFAEAIPLRVTDQLGSRIIAAVKNHTRALDATLQRDKESLEELGKVIAGLDRRELTTQSSEPPVVEAALVHLPEGWNERAFPPTQLGRWVEAAHRSFVGKVGNLEDLLALTKNDVAHLWKSVAAEAAENAFSTLDFDQVATSAGWNSSLREEIVQRAIRASLDDLPEGSHPVRCLISVPESWRSYADQWSALFHPCKLRLPDVLVVSVAPSGILHTP